MEEIMRRPIICGVLAKWTPQFEVFSRPNRLFSKVELRIT
jgi:hypothetical protein